MVGEGVIGGSGLQTALQGTRCTFGKLEFEKTTGNFAPTIIKIHTKLKLNCELWKIFALFGRKYLFRAEAGMHKRASTDSKLNTNKLQTMDF